MVELVELVELMELVEFVPKKDLHKGSENLHVVLSHQKKKIKAIN